MVTGTTSANVFPLMAVEFMDTIEKDIYKEFHVCDKCSYERGFHVSFVKREETFEIVLICPNCGQSYKVKWDVELG